MNCKNEKIILKNHAKLLGVVIDHNLKWSEHIDQLCKKLSRVTFALRILRQPAGVEALKTVYFAYFQSIMMYGIEFWGMAADYLIKRVFILQKQAIRIIAGVSSRESCRALFKDLNILSLPALY